eukprot:GHVT01101802.1.p1 GENE.GHVT01101802.1~~GHVT01101802.1.p1  ORF type:complete len:133 (-),score=16.35 GHVT01101802.1:50-448(-)
MVAYDQGGRSAYRPCTLRPVMRLSREVADAMGVGPNQGLDCPPRGQRYPGTAQLPTVVPRLPVVALESTIISHGLPYPQNLQTARELEAIIRKAGAVPATIGILDGKICVGMEDAQLQEIASKGPKLVQKVS